MTAPFDLPDVEVRVALSTLVQITTERDEARASARDRVKAARLEERAEAATARTDLERRLKELGDHAGDLEQQRDLAVNRLERCQKQLAIARRHGIHLSSELREARGQLDSLRREFSEYRLRHYAPSRIVPPPVYGTVEVRPPNLVTCGEPTAWPDRPCTLVPGHPGQHTPVVYHTAKTEPHTHGFGTIGPALLRRHLEEVHHVQLAGATEIELTALHDREHDTGKTFTQLLREPGLHIHVYDGNGDCRICGVKEQPLTSTGGWVEPPEVHGWNEDAPKTNDLGWPTKPWSISLGKNALPAVKAAVDHAVCNTDHDPRVFLGIATDTGQNTRWECPDCLQPEGV